jgi:signal transduction histidine kinase
VIALEKISVSELKFYSDLKSAVNQAIHQCNNHLAIILSNSELTLALQNPETTLKKTESSITRVALLTDLLAQLSQLFNADLSFSEIDLASLIKHEMSHHTDQAKAEGLEVNLNVECAGSIHQRPNVLKLLIHLLFRNAVSALSTSEVKIMNCRAHSQGNKVILEISNSGNAPEISQTEAVFSSFFGTKKDTSCDFLGAAASLTKLLGGQITYSRIKDMNTLTVVIDAHERNV